MLLTTVIAYFPIRNCLFQFPIDDSSMPGLRLDHITGIAGCGHYQQRPGTQPGGPALGSGREKVELVTGGRGWVIDAGQPVEVGPGTLIWNIPGDRMISRSDESSPYGCLSITWSVSHAQRQNPRITRWADVSEVLACCRQLVNAFSDVRIDRQTLAQCSYAQLHWRAQLHAATVADPVMPEPLRQVTQALEEHPEHDWSVRGMARMAGWGASRLHAGFREHLRTTPHQHVLELRLRRARTMLATGNAELDEIARGCGLGSAAALCRWFRKSVGMTPGEYRGRQR